MKPRISVIIPVYNVGKYLRGCLDSLLAQTFTDYEAVCVNDGSTDGSLAILEEYAQSDIRIKIFSQKNQGQSIARNMGLGLMCGEYVFFLDADDYIHPQALEFMYRCATEHSLELVHAGYKGTENLYKPILANLDYRNIEIEFYNDPIKSYFKMYQKKLIGLTVIRLYRASLLKEIRFISSRLYEEESFIAQVMEKCVRTARLDFDMYNYYYGRAEATTYRFDEQVLCSHLSNIRFLCEHFSYNKDLLKLIKKGKVKTILFNSCMKSFPYINDDYIYNKLKKKLVYEVRELVNDNLINYKDFGLLDRYKLNRLLNGELFTLDIIVRNFIRKIYRWAKR